MDADEYDTVGIDENDRNLDNQQQVVVARFKSSYPRSPSSKKDIAASNQTPKLPPTPPCTSLFSSLFKQNPQSSTTNTTTSILPSENSCRKRLAQISHEIHKATSMMHRTQIKSVHIACSQRITKLQNERRWYQIIQERHKIQSMMMSTRVESVVLACRERLKQLVIELESVQRYDIMEGNGAENEQLAYTSSAFANAEYDDAMVVEEDGNNRWYDRVLRYVQGPATDERIHEDELADYYARERQHHYPSPGTTRYEGEGRHQHATYAMLYPPVAHAASATTTTQCGSLHDYM